MTDPMLELDVLSLAHALLDQGWVRGMLHHELPDGSFEHCLVGAIELAVETLWRPTREGRPEWRETASLRSRVAQRVARQIDPPIPVWRSVWALVDFNNWVARDRRDVQGLLEDAAAEIGKR